MTTDLRATVLIVEDDPGIAELERDRLEEAGYRPLVAESAEAALRVVEGGDVDLILLDYRLPDGRDGLDFFTQVKEAGHDIPVILVTGFSSEATVIQALRIGVRDFVTKSLEYLDYLPDAVGRVLGQVRTERQLASIITSAKDAIISTGPDNRITLFNPAAEAMFRCPASEAIGQSLVRFIPKEFGATPHLDGSGDEDPTASALARDGHWGRRSDGEWFPLESSVSRSEVGGRHIHTVVVRDVTERERLAGERAALLNRLQIQIERMPMAYLSFDAELRLVDWNAAAERTFGYGKEEILGIGPPYSQLVPESGWPEAQHTLQRLQDGDMSAHAVSENSTKDGRTITCEWFNTPLIAPDGTFNGIISLVQDVTDRKLLEEQFRQAQKMDAVGQLAGGIAHDFNNLLTVISGFTDMVLADLPLEDANRAMLEEVFKAGERASLLTRQLLTFSRKELITPKLLDLGVVVESASRMLRRLIGEDVRLATETVSKLDQVRADAGHIEQVIVNLAVNARDAMPTGGRIMIATSNVIRDKHSAGPLPPGRYVLLSVSDTGCGMTEEVKRKIFDPFFTTKEVGKGTGLGLSTVFGIVQQSGGHIEVDTELGRGTSFRIYLPSAGLAASSGELNAARPALPVGNETILLVEDDATVSRMTRQALQMLGYRVLEARGGDEAIAISESHPDAIQMLLTDVVMPGISGRQVAEAVVQTRPAIKLLYVSGYTDDAVIRHGIQRSEVAFLQKPSTQTALALKVREVLDG
jgi:two-component system cell cycle sensor histidine kinase/response regulator CckA